MYLCLVLPVLVHAYEFQMQDNVIFRKVHDVYMNNGRWLVTFVHDLKPYYAFIETVAKHVKLSESILSSELEFLQKYNYTGIYETYNSLSLEIDMIEIPYHP